MLAAFAAHEVFRDVEQRGQEAFLEILLQRRFLSLQFSLVYDIGIDGLTDRDALRLVREILREEYPDASGAAPSAPFRSARRAGSTTGLEARPSDAWPGASSTARRPASRPGGGRPARGRGSPIPP